MAGSKRSLCFVILDALAHAADPDSVAIIGALLRDPEEVIASGSAIALFTLGREAEDLRPAILEIRFPRRAVNGARARGVEPPEWLPATAIGD